MSDTCQISLTYRGVLGHRGVRISRASYGKTWSLRLANGLWTLTDHAGGDIHSFAQVELHRMVAFPGSMRGYPHLYLFGLGPQVHCFQPARDVVDALTPYVERSERVNAPKLSRWHRAVGVGLLCLGVLCMGGCVAGLVWALRSDELSGFSRLNRSLLLAPFGVVGGYFVVVAMRESTKAKRFSRMTSASEPLAS